MRMRLAIALCTGLLLTAAALAVSDVPTDVTADDKRYAALILSEAGYQDLARAPQKPTDFEGEVRTIVAVQDAILKVASKHKAIAFGRERELKDLYALKYGHCFDRSRGIEKALEWLGFETRHVAVYAKSGMPGYLALVYPGVDSHAVPEVRTQKGWMVIDSNKRWIGLDQSRRPVSLDALQKEGSAQWTWASESSQPIHPIFEKPFVQVRGLYSRHGYFFPPFVPFPDLNVKQLVSNVID